MMRRTQLRRLTPLAPGKPLARTSTPAPGSGLARHTRMRPVSSKRARENRERRRLVNELFGGEQPPCARPGCARLADDIHEILPRARSGGSITDPSIWAPLCRQDNDEATLEPEWAYTAGLLFHSWQAGEARACGLLRPGGLFAAWMTADGQLVREAPALGGERVA